VFCRRKCYMEHTYLKVIIDSLLGNVTFFPVNLLRNKNFFFPIFIK